MGKKIVKYAVNIVIVLAFAFGSLAILFRNAELKTIFQQIEFASTGYIVTGGAFVAMFVCSESVIMHYLFKHLKIEITLRRCILLSNIGFFFAGITPGASGGQPLQILYMTRCGIDTLQGTLVCVIITICYKTVLILLNLIFMILTPDTMFGAISDVPILYAYGVISTVVFLGFLIICIYKTSIADKLVLLIIKLAGKLKIIRNTEQKLQKAVSSIRDYEEAARTIRHNLNLLALPMLITTVQRLLFFSVAYLIVRSLHVPCSWVEIVGTQLVLSLAVDVLPIPGAAGANESVFVILLKGFLTEELVLSALLLNRGLTYYLIIIGCGIVTVLAHLYFTIIMKKKTAKEIHKNE